MTAAIITHPACALHEHGAPYHVEIPERLEAIQTCFDEAGMDAMTTPYLSPQATREQLVRAHHPDYVETVFLLSPSTGYVDLDSDTYYPGTGADTNSPGKLNLPMPKGTDAQTWREAVSTHWLPALREFRPQLVMISAGFDSHAEDEMGNFQLQDEDYAWITAELCQIAADFAEGRVVSCLEGGYTLLPLGRAATAHIRVLANYPEN